MDDYKATSDTQEHESQLDFVNYWEDQSVGREILRGHQLREAKPHGVSTREYDVVNINYIKPPRSAKLRAHRRGSLSPFRSEVGTQKNRKKKKKSPCGMRIAELAVPTKRQCLEAWRNNYEKLPSHMVDRLRQYILDQRPVVQVADAMYSFKLKKSPKKGKSDRVVEKHLGRPRKTLRVNEIKTLCAIFGHKIAKKLIIPAEIKLNEDLAKVANIISFDILDLMNKSKKVDMRKKINQDMHIDVTKKITIWISDILEEASFNFLEDQCKEFEEELGPVYDFIDELVDNVEHICEPEQDVTEESSSSESENLKDQVEYLEENLMSDEDNAPDKLEKMTLAPKDDENIESQVKNELITIIDSIFKEGRGEGVDSESSADVNEVGDNIEENNDTEGDANNIKADDIITEEKGDMKSEPDVYEDVENEADAQQSEFGDAHDNFGDALETNDDVDDIIAEQNENAPDEETTAEEESNKKVKFNEDEEANVLAGDELADSSEKKLSEKSSLAHIEFSSPNEDLLSDADESWPDEIPLPVVRPSASASKSITSLGRITEVEEKPVPSEENGNEPEDVKSIAGHLDEVKESDKTPQQITPGDTIVPEDTKILEKESRTVQKLSRTKEKPDKDKNIKQSSTSKGRFSKETKKINERKSTNSRERNSAQPETKSNTTESKIAKPIAQKVRPTPIPKQDSPVDKTKEPTKTTKTQRLRINLAKRKDRTSISKDKTIDNSELESTTQSVKDLSYQEGKETAKDIKFASLRVKPRANNYRVNVDTAPAWVTRSNGEPSCVCIESTLKSKPSHKLNYHKDIRKWVRDLENGYENLKLWNDWIDTTSRTINILQQEIGGLILPEKCNKKRILSKLMELKTNIDKDASLWRKLRKSTQERLKSYKRIYQIHRVKVPDCNKTLPY